jgi:hypothetical protein
MKEKYVLYIAFLLQLTYISCAKDKDTSTFDEEISITIDGKEYKSNKQSYHTEAATHSDYPNPELSSYGMGFSLDTNIYIVIYWGYIHNIKEQYEKTQLRWNILFHPGFNIS